MVCVQVDRGHLRLLAQPKVLLEQSRFAYPARIIDIQHLERKAGRRQRAEEYIAFRGPTHEMASTCFRQTIGDTRRHRSLLLFEKHS